MGQNKPLNSRDNLKVTRKSAFAEFANTGIFGKWYWNNVRARPNHAKVYEKLSLNLDNDMVSWLRKK